MPFPNFESFLKLVEDIEGIFVNYLIFSELVAVEKAEGILGVIRGVRVGNFFSKLIIKIINKLL